LVRVDPVSVVSRFVPPGSPVVFSLRPASFNSSHVSSQVSTSFYVSEGATRAGEMMGTVPQSTPSRTRPLPVTSPLTRSVTALPDTQSSRNIVQSTPEGVSMVIPENVGVGTWAADVHYARQHFGYPETDDLDSLPTDYPRTQDVSLSAGGDVLPAQGVSSVDCAGGDVLPAVPEYGFPEYGWDGSGRVAHLPVAAPLPRPHPVVTNQILSGGIRSPSTLRKSSLSLVRDIQSGRATPALSTRVHASSPSTTHHPQNSSFVTSRSHPVITNSHSLHQNSPTSLDGSQAGNPFPQQYAGPTTTNLVHQNSPVVFHAPVIQPLPPPIQPQSILPRQPVIPVVQRVPRVVPFAQQGRLFPPNGRPDVFRRSGEAFFQPSTVLPSTKEIPLLSGKVDFPLWFEKVRAELQNQGCGDMSSLLVM
jgi:hypothetical protein